MNSLKQYFTFTRRERNGIIILSSILVVLIIANLSVDYFVPVKEVDYAKFAAEIEALERSGRKPDEKTGIFMSDSVKNTIVEKDRSLRKTAKPPISTIELNSATVKELEGLRGIGPVYAERIKKYGEILGGYCNKEQLLEVYGIKEELYESIKKHITVDASRTVQLNLNDASFRDLLAHPYLDKEMVNNITIYREKYGEFNDIAVLRDSNLVNNEIYRKLVTYLKLK